MPVLDLRDIHKSFDGTKALDDASIRVPPGTVHALLGENGAGKTTLMRIAFGMLPADLGVVTLNDVPMRLDSPADAITAGIGMVHQHFALVPGMSVAENVALGGSGRFDLRHAIDTITRLSAETGLPLDPSARVGDLSIGGQQRVEILKALSRNARILILDEPTAVLPPTEALSLLDWIRKFAHGERSAILITHKVREALRIADHVTVLRRGHTVLSKPAASTSEDDLALAMVDHALIPRRSTAPSLLGSAVLTLDRVTVRTRGDGILGETSLTVRGGELLGIAGVEGSGYHELMRVIAGRLRPSTGHRSGPDSVAFIPEDRQREAIGVEMTAAENVALRGAGRRRRFMDWRAMRRRTLELAEAYDVRGPIGGGLVRHLSGGNQQKLVLARELGENPDLVVAESPTRGLDLIASAAVRSRLTSARQRGAGVVVYSRDLEELLALADRIVVVHANRVIEVPLHMSSITRALVGLHA